MFVMELKERGCVEILYVPDCQDYMQQLLLESLVGNSAG